MFSGEISSLVEANGLNISSFPRIVDYPIASGSAVVAAEWLKEQIKKSNRGICAAEMEAYAILNARDTVNKKIPIFLIKAVTDPATKERKDFVDGIKLWDGTRHRPLVRFFSLNCAAALAKCIMPLHEAVVAAEDPGMDPVSALSISRLPSYLSTVKDEAIGAVVEGYSKVFSLISDAAPDIDWIPNFHKIILGSEAAELKISGTSGTGKSTLLGCLYIHHVKGWKDGSIDPIPLFIDLQFYMNRETRHFLPKDIKNIKSAIRKSASAILYIDGYDEYLRHHAAGGLADELNEGLSGIAGVKRVIAVGTTSPRYGLRYKDFSFEQNAVPLVELGVLSGINPSVPDLISEFSRLMGLFGTKISANDLKANLDVIDARHIDLFTLWMAASPKLSASFSKQNASVGTVYYDFVLSFIKFCCPGIGQANSCFGALEKNVFEEQISSDDFLMDGSIPEALVQFTYRHPSIRQFLVAKYILEVCLDNTETLGSRIYNYGINRFLKSLVNRRDSEKQRLLHGIIELLKGEQEVITQAHLVYILGRLELKKIEQQEVERVLRKILPRTERLLKGIEEGVRVEGAASDGQWMLLLMRTLYISLIYLGDKTLANEYVQNLLNKKEWDSLNRGFHLQYYGDLPITLGQVNMVASDNDLSVQPSIIIDILIEKLSRYSHKSTYPAVAIVEFHTLLSLCINRHVEGFLDEESRRLVLPVVLQFSEKFSSFIPIFYRGYMKVALEALAGSDSSILSISEKCMMLKDELRSGWSYEGPRREKKVNRSVSRSMGYCDKDDVHLVKEHCQQESVADHSWACAMLAWMFLSDTGAYDKQKIIKMLLVHDLAEAETGDLVSKKRVDERPIQAKFAALGFLDRFRGAQEWQLLFDEYEEASSLESRICHDIDKIEAYLQAIRYQRSSDNIISDFDDWRPHSLRSDEGTRMLEALEKGRR